MPVSALPHNDDGISFEIVAVHGSEFPHLAFIQNDAARPETTSCNRPVARHVPTPDNDELCPACLDAEVAAGRIRRED
jgi:hypothetical protein